MSIISVQSVKKVYRQYSRFPGIFGAFRSLVTREYTEEYAVNNISFEIEHGDAVGYLGPNGAGKSTMIKMLTGILTPTEGNLSVLGKNPSLFRKQNAKKFGVVFGQRSQLWWDLPLIDSFDLHKYVYKLSNEVYRKNLEFCSELLSLHDFIKKPVRLLSLGQRMRAEVALALLHEPEVLFLDEPTIGLDVMAKDQIRQFLRTVNREKKVTILLTTHDLKDIEEICPRMLIVHKGELVYDGIVSGLRDQLGISQKITILFKNDPGIIEFPDALLIRNEGKTKTYLLSNKDIRAYEWISRVAMHYAVEDITIMAVDIEDVIRNLYENLLGKKD